MIKKRTLHSIILAMTVCPCLCSTALVAEHIEHLYEMPDFDRWMYPFNFSAGVRETAVTFSSIGGGFEIFDDRDAQVLLGFVTQNEVPANLALNQYTVTSITLQIATSNSGNLYDSTIDTWETYSLKSGIADSDAGRPMELFGTAFRGGYDGWSFGEDGTFPMGAIRRERNAYPIEFDEDGSFRDVSNNVLDEYTPAPFALGQVDGIEEGGVIPSETVFTFHVDVSDPDIQCYFRKSFQDGLINLCVTSLHEAQQPGFRGLLQPNFHMKESWAVQFELVNAAQLYVGVEVDEQSGPPEDLDGDGLVGISDVLVILSEWGSCSCCPSDLNADGEVNVSDLLSLIAAWDV
jgi:hypothetical protein